MRSKYLSVFADKRMLIVLILGFSSGLPLALTGATLQAWLTDAKMDIATIGLFALVGLPYTMKFVWAPFLDRYALPFLGLRRGWGVVSQIGLFFSICALAFVDPVARLDVFSLFAFLVAFFSASQDIVIDAYRTEILDKSAYGAGAAISVTGYRLATIISGGIAFAMADHYSWKLVYLCMAVVSLVGLITLIFSPEPNIRRSTQSANLRETLVGPFRELFQREGTIEILLFVMIYKLSTLMATSLTTRFLKEIGYSNTMIGTVNKGAGLTASIIGTLVGGALMAKFGLKRSLWMFGIIQSLVGITFWAMPHIASLNPTLSGIGLVSVISIDQFMMGLGTAAILGFMMTVCSQQFTGTQFALLSSLTAVPRVILVAQAGVIVEKIGWGTFFLATVPLSIPGLLLLRRFDQWQKPSSKVKASISLFDQITIFIFMLSLIALTSDPFWRWLELKDVGQQIVLVGAIGVVFVIAAGLLKPFIISKPT